MARRYLSTGAICHVFNRGVEKRDVFLEDGDYVRFVHDLYEFNDKNPAPNLAYYLGRSPNKEVGLPNIERGPRELLVEILAFCLMPNHFHLMMRQIKEGGITEFMRKLGTGYTNYFNQKYERVGSLFQGKYKVAIVGRDAHLIHLPHYIHTNPVDLLLAKNGGKVSVSSIINFLKQYRWSSFPDYLGQKNFPSVIQGEFLVELLGNEKDLEKETKKWFAEREDNLKRMETIKFD